MVQMCLSAELMVHPEQNRGFQLALAPALDHRLLKEQRESPKEHHQGPELCVAGDAGGRSVGDLPPNQAPSSGLVGLQTKACGLPT